MAEAPQYRLVSDALHEAAYGNAQDTPVYRQWLSYMGSFESKVPACWDEEEVISHVRKMLTEASRLFAFLPEPVRTLKETHEAAEKGGVEYIRYALSLKLKEVSDVISSAKPKAYFEKALRNIQRGIERRLDKIGNFDLIGIITKIVPTLDELEDLATQEERLTSAITIFQILEEMRTKLTTRLAELGGPINIEGRTDNRSNTLDLTAADFAINESVEADQSPAKSSKKKKGKDKAKPETVREQTPPKVEEFDAAEISLTKLRKAIELAEICGKLRVIVPHREVVRQNHEAKWQQLFEKIGYTGKVEFLTFEELNRSKNGLEIPLVMVRSINTHNNLWNKKKYRNIFVLDVKNENAIMAIL